MSTVLPASPAWGFKFASATGHSFGNSSTVPTSAPMASPTPAPTQSKRKMSFSSDCIEEDQSDQEPETEEPLSLSFSTREILPMPKKFSHTSGNSPLKVAASHHYNNPFTNSNTYHNTSASTTSIFKRHRTSQARGEQAEIFGRPLPVNRLLDSLDKKTLISLLGTLSNQYPEVCRAINLQSPKPTVGAAIDMLTKYQQAVFTSMPYKGNLTGDYAFLRVKPALDEFLQALIDYTSAMLPPVEDQISNTFAFLDQATGLLHQLPNWATPANNQSKYDMYHDITRAWCMAIEEASKKSGGMGLSLSHSGLKSKLELHNHSAAGRLQRAVDCINNELGLYNNNSSDNNYSTTLASSQPPLSSSSSSFGFGMAPRYDNYIQTNQLLGFNNNNGFAWK
ncbi:Cut8-domain-containing protein [Nadsonia fulvescens var. elongata DSM 6958]|uniref:Tethering factor for nuclear proteasome STS1 n=1 Tax=Nadsonia fulvescens var. elongata DSM 6958 TaxID=857566 RepID=A0A1E3PI37_9ASCO|nr:Cut8-domain-containing protein [Nadsonia fulvescens var. elongata DSM 6958]